MANLKISQFTVGGTPTDNDEIAGYLAGGGAGSNRQWKFSQIITYLLASATFIAGIVALIIAAMASGGGLSGYVRTQGQILATSLNCDMN